MQFFDRLYAVGLVLGADDGSDDGEYDKLGVVDGADDRSVLGLLLKTLDGL